VYRDEGEAAQTRRRKRRRVYSAQYSQTVVSKRVNLQK
jgi:hypothetical protein